MILWVMQYKGTSHLFWSWFLFKRGKYNRDNCHGVATIFKTQYMQKRPKHSVSNRWINCLNGSKSPQVFMYVNHGMFRVILILPLIFSSRCLLSRHFETISWLHQNVQKTFTFKAICYLKFHATIVTIICTILLSTSWLINTFFQPNISF